MRSELERKLVCLRQRNPVRDVLCNANEILLVAGWIDLCAIISPNPIALGSALRALQPFRHSEVGGQIYTHHLGKLENLCSLCELSLYIIGS